MRNEVSVVPKNEKKDLEISDVYEGAQVIRKLENLIDRVTEKECTAQNVQAAINCVEAINGLLRTHLEQQRINLERDRMRRALWK